VSICVLFTIQSATFFFSFFASQNWRMSGISTPQDGFWQGSVRAQM
jgi:hypothetical protein